MRSRAAECVLRTYLTISLIFALCSPVHSSADKWTGVDETVVEKVAKEHGREAHEPLINTDQGDLLLFLFLTAGAVGGFAAGYSWRMLTERKRGRKGATDHASP